METSGNISLTSSSLILLNKDRNSGSLNTVQVKIFNETGRPVIVNNVSMNDLKIFGAYVVSIDALGHLELPSKNTIHDYIGLDLPSGFNMTVRSLSKGLSHIDFAEKNQSSVKSLIISNFSAVKFYGIRPESPAKSISLLLKTPEMKIDGHTSIKRAAFDGFLNLRGGMNTGEPLDLDGHFESKFEFADTLDQFSRDDNRTKYITYLNKISMNGNISEDKDLNLPGDVYFKLKGTENDIDLKKVLTSSNNIITLIILIPIVVVIGKLIWHKQRL